jgi:membrane protease YdiL (CAAX protease family)
MEDHMTTLNPITPSTTAPDEVEQHSLPATIAYHLLPGLLILAVTVAAVPVVRAAGLPPIAALVLAFLVALLPVQLGHLLIQGWRRNGRLSLAGIVLYRQRLSWWLYPPLVVGMLAWSWLMWFALTPISTTLKTTVFAWLPPGFAATSSADAAGLLGYPRSALLLTFGAYIILNGLAGPIVEELYFRGYLLPRLSRFGRKAPLLETLLFTVYHFWQPWLYPAILAAFAAVVFRVYRTRNIYVGMWAHCLLNLSGGLTITALVLGGAA